MASWDARKSDRILGALSDHVQLAFECHVISEPSISADECLPQDGFPGFSGVSQRRVVCGNGAPAEEMLAFFSNDPLKNLLAIPALRRVLRTIDHPGAILTKSRKLDSL